MNYVQYNVLVQYHFTGLYIFTICTGTVLTGAYI